MDVLRIYTKLCKNKSYNHQHTFIQVQEVYSHSGFSFTFLSKYLVPVWFDKFTTGKQTERWQLNQCTAAFNTQSRKIRTEGQSQKGSKTNWKKTFLNIQYTSSESKQFCFLQVKTCFSASCRKKTRYQNQKTEISKDNVTVLNVGDGPPREHAATAKSNFYK